MKKLEITGQILVLTNNFLLDCAMRVRIGKKLSTDKIVENGESQGSPLNSTLFNIMMSDFPTHWSKKRTMLFANDIMDFTEVKRPIESETNNTTTSHRRLFSLGQEVEI